MGAAFVAAVMPAPRIPSMPDSMIAQYAQYRERNPSQFQLFGLVTKRQIGRPVRGKMVRLLSYPFMVSQIPTAFTNRTSATVGKNRAATFFRIAHPLPAVAHVSNDCC